MTLFLQMDWNEQAATHGHTCSPHPFPGWPQMPFFTLLTCEKSFNNGAQGRLRSHPFPLGEKAALRQGSLQQLLCLNWAPPEQSPRACSGWGQVVQPEEERKVTQRRTQPGGTLRGHQLSYNVLASTKNKLNYSKIQGVPQARMPLIVGRRHIGQLCILQLLWFNAMCEPPHQRYMRINPLGLLK